MKGFIITFLILWSCTIIGIQLYKSVTLNRECTGLLKRAADSNSVDLAKGQLDKAITWLEGNNLTTGYTSIFYRTPDEDIEFWYKNLKTCQVELSKVDSTTTALERSNILMKLRETLLDNNPNNTVVTYPEGLYVYPNNIQWFILNILLFINIILGVAFLLIWFD